MKWLEVIVTAARPAAEAVGDLLFQSRVNGLEELPAGERTVRLRAYLPFGRTTAVTLDTIRAHVAALPSFGLGAAPGTVETAEVDDEGWAEAWKTAFRAFPVGRRLWITPSWDETPPREEAVVVELDPGMAFGSGLHASTQMCLEALEWHLRPGAVVLDVGTGSGILAIAAAKLGAARVRAIDADPVAVAVARQNVSHNGVAAVVCVREGDLLVGVEGAADVVLANLTADLHLTFLPSVVPHLSRDGIVVASGITEHRSAEVRAVGEAAGLTAFETLSSAEWRCLVFRISSPSGR